MAQAKVEGISSETCFEHVSKRVVEYWELFGNKYCCVSDVRKVMQRIPAEFQLKTCSSIFQLWVASLKETSKNSPDAVRKELNYLMLAQEFGKLLLPPSTATTTTSTTTTENGVAVSVYIEYLTKRYFTCIAEPYSKEVTENHFADDFLLMILPLLLPLASVPVMSLPIPTLLEALALCEIGLQKSQHQYLFKYCILAVTRALGLGSEAVSIYQTLDVKHILMDTLAWCILPLIEFHTLEPSQSLILLQQMGDFFDENTKYTIDYILKAFTNGVYSNIPEFYRFHHRIESSSVLAFKKVETVKVNLLRTFSWEDTRNALRYLPIFPSSNEALNSLTFNADTAVIQNHTSYVQNNSFFHRWLFPDSKPFFLAFLKMEISLVTALHSILFTKPKDPKSLLVSIQDYSSSASIVLLEDSFPLQRLYSQLLTSFLELCQQTLYSPESLVAEKVNIISELFKKVGTLLSTDPAFTKPDVMHLKELHGTVNGYYGLITSLLGYLNYLIPAKKKKDNSPGDKNRESIIMLFGEWKAIVNVTDVTLHQSIGFQKEIATLTTLGFGVKELEEHLLKLAERVSNADKDSIKRTKAILTSVISATKLLN